MDAISSLWTAAPELKSALAVFVIMAQILLTVWCYIQLSKNRMKAAKSGEVAPEIYVATGDAEPEHLRVYTRLVANQFEMPVLFYVIMLTGLATAVTSWITIILGAIYVLFRILHAKEMAGEHVVLRRRKLFIRSTQILLLMFIELGLSTIFKLFA